jgi:hypothetical protein
VKYWFFKLLGLYEICHQEGTPFLGFSLIICENLIVGINCSINLSNSSILLFAGFKSAANPHK